MNENTLKKGAKGESCFCNDWAWALEGANALGMVDETGKYTEGEYRMADGSLVELKSDFRCLAIKDPTRNIPIEIYHSGHEHDYGWYQHCIANNVNHINFLFFRSETKGQPCAGIKILMNKLEKFITEHGNEYPTKQIRDGKDIVRFICVPIEDIIINCCKEKGCSVWPTQKTDEMLRSWLQNHMNKNGFTGLVVGGVKSAQFVMSPPDDEQSPENTEDVNETGLERNDDV
jgi:hypothetical protein